MCDDPLPGNRSRVATDGRTNRRTDDRCGNTIKSLIVLCFNAKTRYVAGSEVTHTHTHRSTIVTVAHAPRVNEKRANIPSQYEPKHEVSAVPRRHAHVALKLSLEKIEGNI